MKISELRARCTDIDPATRKPVAYINLSFQVKGLDLTLAGSRGKSRGRILSVSETAQGYSCVATYKTSEILSLIEGLDADGVSGTLDVHF